MLCVCVRACVCALYVSAYHGCAVCFEPVFNQMRWAAIAPLAAVPVALCPDQCAAAEVLH